MNAILIIGLLLALKHFIFDGPLQKPYQYMNKGKLFHPGGWLHAFNHGLGTFAAIAIGRGEIPPQTWWLLIPVVEIFAHFAIDYAKTNLTAGRGWSLFVGESTSQRAHLRIYSDYYFWALVADQALHFACYAVIIWLVAS